MRAFDLEHLSNRELEHRLVTCAAEDRDSTAKLLAHIAEFDRRRLYVPAGFPSMFEYCVRELRLSEHSAFTRIRAARAARKFPGILDAIADGRLNLTSVVLVAPSLMARDTSLEAGVELLAAVELKRKPEVERLLAERFPRPDLAFRMTPLPAPKTLEAPRPVLPADSTPAFSRNQDQLAPELVGPESPVVSAPAGASAEPQGSWARLKPLAPQRLALQVTVDQEFDDLLREAQALMSHSIPSGDVATVLKQGLRELVTRLRKHKFAETQKPRPRTRSSKARTIPAHVRRAVWARDEGRCTFVSESGHRCESRKLLEFDHVQAVALGGLATVSGIRLRCQAHNQYEAEIVFGERFMEIKRQRGSTPVSNLIHAEGSAAT